MWFVDITNVFLFVIVFEHRSNDNGDNDGDNQQADEKINYFQLRKKKV